MVKPVYLIGDVHGKFEQLMYFIKDYGIKDCYLICVGDLGIGFKNNYQKERRAIDIYNEFFKKRGIHFMSIRGNHDDPSYFYDMKGKDTFSNFELLDDYSVKTLNAEKFLFVGGAVSIDRTARSLGSSYWENEEFYLVPEKIVECDILITHSAPSWLGPFDKDGIIGWCERDKTLWDECFKERMDIDQLVERSKAKRLYCGHFHMDVIGESNGCIGRILDELEIKEHR